jgi:putative transposase
MGKHLPNRKSTRLPGYDYATPGVYHITAVTLKRAPVFADARFAGATLEVMHAHREQFGYQLYSFALMPDHWHVLLNPVGSNRSVSELIGGLKSFSTRAAWTLGWEGRIWQERFHDRIIRLESENPIGVTRYILENPVKAGLVTESTLYPYCGTLDPLE